MPRKKTETNDNSVSLLIASSFPAAWETTLLPWFKRLSLASFITAKPTAVVTPYPSCAAFLREKLVENSISSLGIKFLTPPQLRELLLTDDARALPLREHLRLLLALAAESVAEKSEDPDLAAIAKSIARAPDNLLRVFDRVSAAGWDLDHVGPPAGRQIAIQFRNLVKKCGFQMIDEADRNAMESARTAAPRFNELLVVGFTAAHWPLLPLLQAAALSARSAIVVLENPREQIRASDESWIGTWEENFKPSDQTTEISERAHPFSDLIQPALTANGASNKERPQFLVGLNATEQAQAISAMALKFLEDESCTRLGVLFPRTGALARLVSDFLTRAGLPHHDGIGHLHPGDFEQPMWRAWLQMQENPQLESVLQFLETNPDSLGELSIEEARRLLRRAYRDILIDDINVLSTYCERHTQKEAKVRVGKLLREIKFLPARSTLKNFLTETEKILSQLKWKNRWTQICQFADKWSDALPSEFSRGIYLRWLQEISNSFEVARATAANHPYSRVHLLPYAEAETQEWSHLILAGLNQGEWPPAQSESGFLPEDQIAELNARAAQRGQQGEGHLVLEKGKTFLIGAQDQRRIALRRFAAALDSVEHGLAITASLLQESAPERLWNPSELFSQIYFATENTPLSQQTMSMLREQTHVWLLDSNPAKSVRSKEPGIQQTRIAYDERRRPDAAFGQYEFALRDPIEREITLRTTEWDKVVKTPALIWLKKYLGVENEDPDLNQWTAATGTWVHDWLAGIGGNKNENVFVEFPTRNQINERSSQLAMAYRKMVTDLCATVGREVPDWWTSGWSNAFALVRFLANKLSEVEAWPQLATEWNLDSPQLISVSDEHKLRIRGRIDLILARKRPNDSKLTGADIWIVDYKTGTVRSLVASGRTDEARLANLRKKLVRGDAIQLGLYGLAARELGSADVDLSILSLRTELDKPQLKIDALATFSDFWNELYEMQERGVFGLRGAIRNEFGFSPDYPLATLSIDKEFLDEKWVLTHPAFADDEESS
ncbi:MAG TPA: PD-(D/E)XK nuclease family protein [Chthoniobacterales bacterium]|nr:PD-(D/E)XK nuclease family protein [Chthoniobacterales bacterium]